MGFFGANLNDIEIPESEEAQNGDTGRALSSGLKGVGAAVGAGARWIGEQTGDKKFAKAGADLEQGLNKSAGADIEEMSKAGRESFEAAINDPKFWEHPGRSVALKAANMTPGMLAAIVPGMLFGSATAAAVAGGALNGTSVMNELYKMTDEKSDEELQGINDFYKELRISGFDEIDAREQLNKKLRGSKALINTIIGAGVGLIGPAGKLARGGAEAERGLIKGTAVGVAEGAGTMALQSGAADASQQSAAVEGGLQPQFDSSRLVGAVLEGGVFGGVMGGVAGAATAKRAPRKAGADIVDSIGVGADEAAALREKNPQPEAAPEAPPEATPPGKQLDTGQNVPESADTLQAQREQLIAGDRKAMMYPTGTKPLKRPDGMRTVVTDRGTFHYDPKQITAGEVRNASANGRENEILGLGPVSKPEVEQRIAAGEQPTAVVEKTPDGTNVREAAGTEQTAPEQRAAMEQGKSPENIIVQEPVQDVMAKRMAPEPVVDGERRILSADEDRPLSAQEKTLAPEEWQQAVQEAGQKGMGRTRADMEEVETGGKKRGRIKQEEYDARKEATAEAAKSVFERNVPSRAENEAPTSTTGQATLRARLTKMLKEAKEEGATLGQRIGDATNDHEAMLIAARELLADLKAKKASEQRILDFKTDELIARSGDFSAFRERRRIDADTASRQNSYDENVKSHNDETEAAPTRGKFEKKEAAVPEAGERTERAQVREPVDISKVERKTERMSAEETKKAAEEAGMRQRTAPVVETIKRRAIKRAEPAKPAPKREEVLAKEGDQRRDRIRAYERTAEQELMRELGVNESAHRIKFGGGEVDVVGSTTVRAALAKSGNVELTGIARAMYPFIRSRLEKTSGEVPLHIVPEHVMNMARDAYKLANAPDGLYSPGDHAILIRESILQDPARAAHVIMHEAVHAATVSAINSTPRIRNAIRSIMKEVVDFDRLTTEKPSWTTIPREPIEKMYAFKNENEFIAEAFSNPILQERLAQHTLTPDLARALGMETPYRKQSIWGAFVDLIRRALGMPEGSYSALEGIIRVGERAMETNAFAREVGGVHFSMPDKPGLDAAKSVVDHITRRVMGSDLASSDRGPRAMMLRTMDNLARSADTYFGGADNNPLRRVADKVEMVTQTAQRLLKQSEPIIENLHQLEKKYSADGTWKKFADLAHDATTFNLHPDRALEAQKHLSRDDARNWQARGKHGEMAARFNALPDDLKKAWREASAHYRTTQNDMNFATLKNVFRAAGHDDEAMVRRAFNEQLTDADKATLGEVLVNHIESLGELKQIQGVYFPLMRRGDHVVTGKYEIATPAGARRLADGGFEFTDREAAKKWMESLDYKADARSVYIDKTTGETFGDDGTRITKQDTDAEQRWRVNVQDKHVEMFEDRSEALRRVKELQDDGKVSGVSLRERRFTPEGRDVDFVSEQARTLMKSLEQRDGYKDMSPRERAELKAALNEASLKWMASTRVQSRRLPRRGVKGASDDLVRNMLDYSQSAAGYLGKLEHDLDIRDAMKDARKYADEFAAQSSDKTEARDRLINEFEKRLSAPPKTHLSKIEAGVQRISTLSFLDKLFSPATNLINATQPIINTAPLLAGRHGIIRTISEMSDAYRTIGGLSNAREGLVNTARALKGDKTSDVGGSLRDRLAQAKDGKRLVEMFDYLAERNAINADAGLEVARLIKAPDGGWGVVDKGLSYAERVARAIPEAMEANNRGASAVAAYRLEFQKSGDHARAMRYALDMVNKTQFNYSASNGPAWMKHPLAKLTLQFKKYAQGQYQLLAEQFNQALHGASREEKLEAARGLAYHAAVVTTLAGALGLPTEPIKLLLTATQPVTGYGMDDFEQTVRSLASQTLGPTLGQAVTRGVTRVLPGGMGFDLSSRIGEDSLVTFAQPKQNKLDDWQAWLWKTLSGAPTALATDWVMGANDLVKGDVQQAAEKLIPIKAVSDSLRSYRQMTEGKKNQSGRETLSSYTPQEAGLRALGFTPAREAETSEMRGAIGGKQREYSEQRRDLIAKWVTAEGPAKAKAMAAISKFNQGKPKDAHIDLKDLTSAAKRRKTEESNGSMVNGLRTTKRDRWIVEGMTPAYGVK